MLESVQSLHSHRISDSIIFNNNFRGIQKMIKYLKNKNFVLCFLLIAFCAVLASFAQLTLSSRPTNVIPDLKSLESKYQNLTPKEWGEKLPGITNILPKISGKPTLYLTFDLCMGDYDKPLVEYLIQNNIHATFFINSRWIEKHPEEFLALAHQNLFAIQNHGTLHRPLSINGREIYGIKGTDSIKEVYEEIMVADRLIAKLTGKKPHYFRSGTAYYDEIAVSIAKDLGYKIGGFDIVGDGGATYSKQKIVKHAQKAHDGSILLYHANKPKSETFAGIQEVIPMFKQRGFSFGKME